MRGVFRLNGRAGGFGPASGWNHLLPVELRSLRAEPGHERDLVRRAAGASAQKKSPAEAGLGLWSGKMRALWMEKARVGSAREQRAQASLLGGPTAYAAAGISG
jgi:hypothetical protein